MYLPDNVNLCTGKVELTKKAKAVYKTVKPTSLRLIPGVFHSFTAAPIGTHTIEEKAISHPIMIPHHGYV